MTVQDEQELMLPKEEKELPANATSPHETHQEHHHGPNEVKTLLSWQAPGRPWRKRSLQFFINSFVIAALIAIIAFLFQQWMLIMVIFSFYFVIVALKIVAPHDFHYRISTEGVTIEDHFYLWQELYDFYFTRFEGHDTLQISTRAFIPGELTIPLGDIPKDHIRSVLLPYLPYREVIRKTFTEKSADWLSRNFPLEKSRD